MICELYNKLISFTNPILNLNKKKVNEVLLVDFIGLFITIILLIAVFIWWAYPLFYVFNKLENIKFKCKKLQ